MVTKHHFLYSTHLYYMLKEPRLAIVRTSSDIALIECHYPRNDVNSQAVWPTWLPFKSLLKRGGFLSYSLRQMNDKWDAERVSNVYYLGELIHIEASVMSIDHEPLRLYVDSCVATVTPDKDSTPRYQLIDFNGCLMDSHASDSCSSFVSPRVQQNKLQISLGAFRFSKGKNLEDQLRKAGEIQMGPLVILASRMQRENQNISNGQGTPEHNGVDLMIIVGVVGAVALLLSALVVGGVVICGSLTINKLVKPSI
ncbi:hypothetical protein chiPu_0018922 [Chiloscyllium punctatum]|uniref:Zona pellucida sperm-binding protein 3 n=1 Tax=Chiloscyllium punctatum TaxID=137246 RepID=A0A401RQE1_CHIPU|nr:hypothetical protein [Chiloscyllium punctatum]